MKKIRVGIIINGKRKLPDFVERIIHSLESKEQLMVSSYVTKEPKEAIDIARKLSDYLVDIIVAVGGDGTVNEVLNGLMMSEKNHAVLGIIPCGTGNDFHRMLGRFNDQAFVDAVMQTRNKIIDCIRIEHGDEATYALNITGIGFDGHVIKLYNKQRNKLKFFGGMTYSIAILRSFFTYRKREIEIHSEGFQYKGKALMITFCNGSTFGNGVVVNPTATIDSGTMAVTIFNNVSILDYLLNLSKLRKGHKLKHAQVFYHNAEVATVHSDPKIACEADGELIPNNVNKFSIEKGKLKLLFPQYEH